MRIHHVSWENIEFGYIRGVITNCPVFIAFGLTLKHVLVDLVYHQRRYLRF